VTGQAVLATSVTDSILECEAPARARPAQVSVRVLPSDPVYHHIALRSSDGAQSVRAFTYYAEPVALQVSPSTLYPSSSPVNLTVTLTAPLDLPQAHSLVCRLEAAASSGQSELSTWTSSADPFDSRTVLCSFPPLDWLHQARLCTLALSLNEGADFSVVYHSLTVAKPPRILSVTPSEHTVD